MKRIAITMGEPGGIGPEIALRAAIAAEGIMPVLVGDRAVLEEASAMFKLSPGSITVIDTGGAKGFTKGKPSAEGGMASYLAIKHAVELVQSGKADAMATAPISKEALRMAGLQWPGHTEMLAELTDTREFAMMLVGGSLRVMLATIHKPLKDVPGLITKEGLLSTLRLAIRACMMLGLQSPRIAVAGLNPHAGESGMFGNEEQDIIAPAIEAARAEGIPASGPWPPDTLFYRALKGEFDLVVAMYHDQGLIPLKLVGFETGVNITVGLPIVRTSPDHGTAYDIAWQGKADWKSMMEAVKLASGIRV
jgi:4-hydroxythreonine-4-phosphate dehydrogenase